MRSSSVCERDQTYLCRAVDFYLDREDVAATNRMRKFGLSSHMKCPFEILSFGPSSCERILGDRMEWRVADDKDHFEVASPF